MQRIPVLQVDVVSKAHLDSVISKANVWSLDIDCTQGACGGSACPINYGDEDTEYSQSMGCLPDPRDIIEMRALDGLTWACHSDYSKACVSGVKLLKALGLPHKVHQLYSEIDTW